jgi:hypothetical protein
MEKLSQLEHECEMPLGFSQFTATSPRADWPLRCVITKNLVYESEEYQAITLLYARNIRRFSWLIRA